MGKDGLARIAKRRAKGWEMDTENTKIGACSGFWSKGMKVTIRNEKGQEEKEQVKAEGN